MNNEPNTTHHPIGALVIHDADAKTDKMLMRVIGYTRAGLCKTRYVNQGVNGRKVYTNEIADLHDPQRPDVQARWKSN